MRRGLLAAPLLLAAPAAAAPNDWMAGRWFGSGQPNDKSEMWLAVLTADGRFHAQFRACRQGKAFDKTNDGTWKLDGAAETISIIKVDDVMTMPRQDHYTILSHAPGKQTYRYDATGFTYTSRRVDAKFEMPRCDLTG
jgi:hypothetical protein